VWFGGGAGKRGEPGTDAMRSYRCQKCGRLHLSPDEDPAPTLCYACWRKQSLVLYPEDLFRYEGPETREACEARSEACAVGLMECVAEEDEREAHRRWVRVWTAKVMGELA